MSDKFKDSFPIEVPFTEGEQPTAQKLGGWSQQTNRGMRLLERALGDLWNQSQSPGTPLFTQQNQITNLARVIGQMQNLNPRRLGGITVSAFSESVPSTLQQFVLQHTPTSALSFSPAAPAAFLNLVATKNDLINDGDYFVDANMKTVWTKIATGSGITVTYDYQELNSSYNGATFNVIPYTDQPIKCAITLDAGGAGIHKIALPLITHDQDGALLTDGSNPNYNAQANLPIILSSLNPNDIVSSGFISLWDNTANAIVEGGTYLYQTQSVLHVTGITLTAGNSRYSLITIGNNITGSLDYLLDKMLNHVHRSDDGSALIKHSNLKELITAGTTDKTGSNSLSFANSKIINNDHPMYLHRAGYKYNKSPDNTDEGTYNNAMVGDILMASTGKTGGSIEYINLTSDSFEVMFGNDTGDSPKFGYVNSDDKLQMKGTKPLRINQGNLYLGLDTNIADRNIVAEIGASVEPKLFYDISEQSWGIQREGGTDTQNLIPPPVGEVTSWWRWSPSIPVPFGWQICDGGVVSDPLSPMFGLAVPDMRSRSARGHSSMPSTGFSSIGSDSFSIPDHAHLLSVTGLVTIDNLIAIVLDPDDGIPPVPFDAFPPNFGGPQSYALNISASMSNDGAVTVPTIPSSVQLNYIVRIR